MNISEFELELHERDLRVYFLEKVVIACKTLHYYNDDIMNSKNWIKSNEIDFEKYL